MCQNFKKSKKAKANIAKYIWNLSSGNNKIDFKTAIEARNLNV